VVLEDARRDRERHAPGHHDRAEEIAEPLRAVAEDAGGDWPARARAAVLALADQDSGGDDHGTLLLAKLRELFGPVSVMASKEIVKHLRDDEELPFDDINAQQVAKLLAPYGIRPHPDQGSAGQHPRVPPPPV
jgi:hypothetical protein